MRLTVLCICGTLLGFLNLSQMKAEEGELLRERGFEPCTATLTPGAACRPGEHDSTCPYLFSLPPLTVHLPLQLGELEKIMQDLQKLKDSVDEVREMCAECTVNQSERECEKQKERDREKLNEGKKTHDDGKKGINVKPEENDRNIRRQCEKDIESERPFEDKLAEEWLLPDENTSKKLEADEKSLKKVIKEHEKEGSQAENRGEKEEIKTESERKKDPPKQMERTATGAKVFNTLGETVAEKNNGEKEVDTNKNEGQDHLKTNYKERLDGEGEKTVSTSKQSNKDKEGKLPQIWSYETKKNDSNNPLKDKIKITTNQDKLKDKKQQHISEERNEMDEVNKDQINEKPKQTERAGNTEKERSIKQGERDKLEKEAEKGSKWKDNDGKISSSTASEKAVFVSISPTSHSTIRISSRSDLLDSIRAKIFTSSLPFPSLPSSTLSSITAVSRDTEAVYGPTKSTDTGAAGFLYSQDPDKEFATPTTTITTMGGQTQPKSSAAPWSASPSVLEAGVRLQHPTSATPTTTPNQKLDITSFTKATSNILETPKKNFSSNVKTGKKPPLSKGPKAKEKPKLGIEHEAEKKQKNSKGDFKPGRIPPVKNPKYNPKQKKPSLDKPKPNKDSKIQISKPGRQIPADVVPTDTNLKNNLTRKHSQDLKVQQTNATVQKPNRKPATPVHKVSFSTQRPQTENTTHLEKYSFIDTERGSDTFSDPNTIPTKSLVDQKSQPEKKQENKEKNHTNERTELSQNSTAVYFKTSQIDTFTTKPNQQLPKTVDGDGPKPHSDSIPGKKVNSDRLNKQKSIQKVPKTDQKLVKKPDSDQRKTPEPPLDEKSKLETSSSTYESLESIKTTPKIIQKPHSSQEPESKSESVTPNSNQQPTQSLSKSSESIPHKPTSNLDLTPGEKVKYEEGVTLSAQEPEFKPTISNISPKHADHDVQRGQTATPKPDQKYFTASVNEFDQNDRNEHKSNLDLSPAPTTIPQTTASPLRPESNKKISKISHKSQPNQKLKSEKSETSTIKPYKRLTESENKSNKSLAHEPKPFLPSTPKEMITSDQINTSFGQGPDSEGKVSEADQKAKPSQLPESQGSEMFTPKTTQKPLADSVDDVAKNLLNESLINQELVKRQRPDARHDDLPSDKKPKPREQIPKNIQKRKPGQVFKPNQKHSNMSEIVKIKPNQSPKTKQVLKNITNPISTRPHQKPNLNSTSNTDKPRKVVPDRTSMPKKPSRPFSRPFFKPVPSGVQKPKPVLQPKESKKTKPNSGPPQIIWTTSNSLQDSQTDMTPTSGLVKAIAEGTHPPGKPEFSVSMRKSNTLSPNTYNSLQTEPNSQRIIEDSTLSPNSWIMSDLKPQKTIHVSMTQSTTRQNNVHHGIPPSVITTTIPGTPHPNLVSESESRTPGDIRHSKEETKPTMPLSSPTPAATSTPKADFKSATTTTSPPETFPVDSFSPSSQELRVKIKQVSAPLNNSMSSNRTPADMLPKQQPIGTMGGNRPDGAGNKRFTSTPTEVKRDCSDLLQRGEKKSGVYLITPDLRSRSFPVLCDMKTEGGGWTVLQHRQDGSESFNRTWVEYQSGFGKLDGEFWLGNNFIHLLTRDRDMVLRVELEDFDGVKGHAEYEQFRVAGERQRYKLTVGSYSGTAGDALHFNKIYDHNNKPFTTPDKDHDRYPSGNCGAYYSSGWWFDACMAANLNGRYYHGKYKGVRDGIFWGTWHNISKEYYPTNERQSFKTVRMMIRPKDFVP